MLRAEPGSLRSFSLYTVQKCVTVFHFFFQEKTILSPLWTVHGAVKVWRSASRLQLWKDDRGDRSPPQTASLLQTVTVLLKLHACVRARSPITRHWTFLPTAAMADLSLSHSLQEQFLQDVRSELVQGLAMERVAKDVLEWLKTREVINAVECENVIAAGSTHHQAEALVSLLMAKPVKEIWLPVWNGLQRYSPHVHAKLHARIASQLGPTALIGMFEYRRAVSNINERKKENWVIISCGGTHNFTPLQNYCPAVLSYGINVWQEQEATVSYYGASKWPKSNEKLKEKLILLKIKRQFSSSRVVQHQVKWQEKWHAIFITKAMPGILGRAWAKRSLFKFILALLGERGSSRNVEQTSAVVRAGIPSAHRWWR